MKNEEKRVLHEALNSERGIHTPSDMINGIARHNRALVENLVVRGYLEEVPTTINTGETMNFYRLSEKGLLFFRPWYYLIWYQVKGDLRTVLISIITSVISSIIAIAISKMS